MAPELPPLAEVGLPGYDAARWHMFVAPAATPKPIVQRLNAEVDAIVKEPDVGGGDRQARLRADRRRPAGAACRCSCSREIERWGKVVRAAGAAGIE